METTIEEKRKKRNLYMREYRRKDKQEEPPEARIRAQWEKNLKALSKEERAKLNSDIDEWNYIFGIMKSSSDAIRLDQKYNTDFDGLPHRPEEYFAEIEAYVKTHPPIFYGYKDGSPCVLRGYRYCSFFEEITERQIADEGFYFRTYGIGIDGVSESTYSEFLTYFRMWYRMYRNNLVLATTTEYGPEYAKTWEEVDQLCLGNPRLKCLVSKVGVCDGTPNTEETRA